MSKKIIFSILLVILCFSPLFLLIGVRQIVQARYIPSGAMEPNLQIEDRILIESVSRWFGRMVERGAIVVFYPPPSEMGGKDLSYDLPHLLGRLTGLPKLPYEPAFVKRIIGLPGDTVRIESGVGVFINNKLLDESKYIEEPANYDLTTLGDIGGRASGGGEHRPYGNSKEPIVVPAGMMFVMGDNRNNTQDSHVYGFVPQDRIIGRAWLMIYPEYREIHQANWSRGSQTE